MGFIERFYAFCEFFTEHFSCFIAGNDVRFLNLLVEAVPCAKDAS